MPKFFIVVQAIVCFWLTACQLEPHPGHETQWKEDAQGEGVQEGLEEQDEDMDSSSEEFWGMQRQLEIRRQKEEQKNNSEDEELSDENEEWDDIEPLSKGLGTSEVQDDAEEGKSNEDKDESSDFLNFENIDKTVFCSEPSIPEMSRLLDQAYTSPQAYMEVMNRYVVGIADQDRPLSLGDAYKKKVLDPEYVALILDKAKDFPDGEISTFNFNFGRRKGQDIVLGSYPALFVARPFGTERMSPENAALGPMVRWLEILGHLTWVSPKGQGSDVSLGSYEEFSYDVQIKALAASISSNHVNSERDQKHFHSLGVDPFGVHGVSGWTDGEQSHAGWLSIMSGWAGLGYTGQYNIEERQMGLSSVGASSWIAGWKNYAQMGASLSTVTESGNQYGMGGVITVSRDRLTSYKYPYKGQYDELFNKFIKQYKYQIKSLISYKKVIEKLIELVSFIDNGHGAANLNSELLTQNSKIAEIEEKIDTLQKEKNRLVHKHFIEVVDSQSHGLRLTGGFFSNGIAIGGRFGRSKGVKKIHRFYTHLKRAKKLIKDGTGDKLALLKIPMRPDTENFPDLRHPDLWSTGVEVIETKEKLYHGSIVMGISGVPGLSLKAGLSRTFKASFELGVRKLIDKKVEVTLRPTEINQKGFFASTLQVVGPAFVKAASISVAMRQTFIFDLSNRQARKMYHNLLDGRLPLNFSVMDLVSANRESENLLDIAILAKDKLKESGVLLTYLEKINVKADQCYVGILNVPGLKNLVKKYRWEGISYDILNGKAKVISTNTKIAIARETTIETKTIANGFKGVGEQSAYATVKRKIEKIKKPSEDPSAYGEMGDYMEDGYSWFFTGMTLRAVLNNSKVVGDEQNQMVTLLNERFNANIESFPQDLKPEMQTREILLEREIQPKDLNVFKSGFGADKVKDAQRASTLSSTIINADLLDHMPGKERNAIADVVLQFISEHGFNGVSAVHTLLSGDGDDLILRTSSDIYSIPLAKASETEALYTRESAVEEGKQIVLDYDSDKKMVNEVYENIIDRVKEINKALRAIHTDPLFVGAKDLAFYQGEYAKLREPKSVIRSKLIASKNKLLGLLDLEKQKFEPSSMMKIFKNLKKKHHNLSQKYFFLEQKYPLAMSKNEDRVEIAERWERVHSLKVEIEQKQLKYTNKTLRKILGDKYVNDMQKELTRLLTGCVDLVDVAGLSPADANDLKKKLADTGGFMQRFKKTGVNSDTYLKISQHIDSIQSAKVRAVE